MSFSKAQLEKVLTLSHLHMTQEEKSAALPELQSILAHMANLDRLDLADTPPSAWTHAHPTPRRSDTIDHTSLPYTKDNAPDWQANGFAVPKIV